MKKRLLCLLLCLAIVLPVGSFALAIGVTQNVQIEKKDQIQTLAPANELLAAIPGSKNAESLTVLSATTAPPAAPVLPTGPYYMVDGVAVADAAMATYNGVAYVSVAVAAKALRSLATVTTDGATVTISAENLTITATAGQSYLVANGRYLYVEGGILTNAGAVIAPVRTVAQACGAEISWDQPTKRVSITSGSGAITSGSQYYNAEELYWLGQIINAESGNQPLNGKIAVGTVIMNRVASSQYPNSVYGAIFDHRYGSWQFTPAGSGAIKAKANAESIVAAKLVLDGARVGGNILYFASLRAAPGCWANRNRPYAMTIAGHVFYN